MRFPALFAMAVGVLLLGQWSFFLATGTLPELRAAPLAIALHLAAEVGTALLLLGGGLGLWRGLRWAGPATLFGLGLLAYTLIQSPGYFAERRAWPLVAMFAVLLVGAVLSAVRLAPELELDHPVDGDA